MSFGLEQRDDLLEAVRLLEAARASLAGATDFDRVRIDSHLVTALTSTKAALHIAANLGPEPGDEMENPTREL